MAVLIKDLHHPDKKGRAAAVQRIVQLGEAAIEPLSGLLIDSDWKVRYRAAETLGLIRSKEPVQDLLQACSDEKDHVRYMAAKALGNIGAADAVPVLIRLLNDEHSYTRGIAATGLAAIGKPEVGNEIESALARESDQSTKEKMLQSLKTLDSKK